MGAWYSGYERISIHVLREEDDYTRAIKPNFQKLFLSTSSARRTTAAPAGPE